MIIYGIVTLLFSLLIYLLLWGMGGRKEYKFWKKHLSKRKTIFALLAFFSLLILWAMLEESFSEITFWVLWGIHIFIFVGYLGWSTWKIIQDKIRISAAERRRMERKKQE